MVTMKRTVRFLNHWDLLYVYNPISFSIFLWVILEEGLLNPFYDNYLMILWNRAILIFNFFLHLDNIELQIAWQLGWQFWQSSQHLSSQQFLVMDQMRSLIIISKPEHQIIQQGWWGRNWLCQLWSCRRGGDSICTYTCIGPHEIHLILAAQILTHRKCPRWSICLIRPQKWMWRPYQH